MHRLEADGVDLIVVDCNPEPEALSTWVLEAVDDIYMVVDDSSRGVQDAYRSTAALRRLGFGDKLAYVVNQSRGRVDFGPTLRDLGGTLLAAIPADPEIAAAEDDHRISSLEGSGPGALALQRLAALIHPAVGGAEHLEASASGWGRLELRPALAAR